MSVRADFTPPVDLLAELGAGAVRRRRPTYVDLLPPCNQACPAGENIQAWLEQARAGRYHEAWLQLVQDNPLPAVQGRCCYHPCEGACNRQRLDSAVSVHAIERFLGDRALREGWTLPDAGRASGKRVLIVGAGPSGLSAAYQLRRLGHAVDIHEAAAQPGGMMQFGIPAYRLPREVLLQEVRRIEATGIGVQFGHRVEDLLAEQVAGRYDAVFLAIGAGQGKNIEIPARDAPRVLDAVSLLSGTTGGAPPQLGRRVVVYGGGNTAMDAARTARRLGAEETLVVYRRDRAHMPAQAFEVEEALEEGIQIRWLTAIRTIDGSGLFVEKVALDAQGRPQPTGQIEQLPADAIVLAVGQQTDSGFLRNVTGIDFGEDGVVKVGADMMTGHAGIFAGGDMVPGEKSVTASVGQGRKAARHIDAWLRAQHAPAAMKHPVVSFGMLHLAVYSDAERAEQPRLPSAERTGGFAEIVEGLGEGQARHEAQRCLSCGNCFECDQCYAACPEQAIEKLGPGRRYRYLYERCTGCAVCFETCPSHAIEMVPEPPAT